MGVQGVGRKSTGGQLLVHSDRHETSALGFSRLDCLETNLLERLPLCTHNPVPSEYWLSRTLEVCAVVYDKSVNVLAGSAAKPCVRIMNLQAKLCTNTSSPSPAKSIMANDPPKSRTRSRTCQPLRIYRTPRRFYGITYMKERAQPIQINSKTLRAVGVVARRDKRKDRRWLRRVLSKRRPTLLLQWVTPTCYETYTKMAPTTNADVPPSAGGLPPTHSHSCLRCQNMICERTNTLWG